MAGICARSKETIKIQPTKMNQKNLKQTEKEDEKKEDCKLKTVQNKDKNDAFNNALFIQTNH